MNRSVRWPLPVMDVLERIAYSGIEAVDSHASPWGPQVILIGRRGIQNDGFQVAPEQGVLVAYPWAVLMSQLLVAQVLVSSA